MDLMSKGRSLLKATAALKKVGSKVVWSIRRVSDAAIKEVSGVASKLVESLNGGLNGSLEEAPEETYPLLAKKNEFDDISTNREEAQDGPLLSINTSPAFISSGNEHDNEANRGNARDGSDQKREKNESDDISTNRDEAQDGPRLSINTSPASISSGNEHDNEANRGNARDGSDQQREVPLWKWILVVFNLTLELPSAAFDQLSLSQKPLYALVAMTLSLLAFALCVIELLYNGLKDKITFRRPVGKIPWFYYPSRSENPERFGTFADLIGLVSAISQCIVTAINYDFARRAANSPIKFSLLPIIFAFGLLCSKIVETLQ